MLDQIVPVKNAKKISITLQRYILELKKNLVDCSISLFDIVKNSHLTHVHFDLR